MHFDRHGWFHKNVSSTSDDIKVRWHCNHPRKAEDVLADLVYIWVL